MPARVWPSPESPASVSSAHPYYWAIWSPIGDFAPAVPSLKGPTHPRPGTSWTMPRVHPATCGPWTSPDLLYAVVSALLHARSSALTSQPHKCQRKASCDPHLHHAGLHLAEAPPDPVDVLVHIGLPCPGSPSMTATSRRSSPRLDMASSGPRPRLF